MRSIKILILCFLSMLWAGKSQAQVQPLPYKDYSAPYQFNIGYGALKNTHASAYLEVGPSSGATKGLLLPRGNKDAITSPARGLVVYDLATDKLWWYTGTAWATAGTGSGGSTVTYQSPLQLDSGVVKWVGTTSNVPEGTNLYFTQGRFNTAFAARSTTNLPEGTNKYYTDARVQAFGDTRYIQASQLALKLNIADTVPLHNQIVALQAQSGKTTTIGYNNGVYYDKNTNTVNAYYDQPIWNGKWIQGTFHYPGTPLDGQVYVYRTALNGAHWEAQSGSGGSSFDPSTVFFYANTSHFKTGTVGGVVGVGDMLDWSDSMLTVLDDFHDTTDNLRDAITALAGSLSSLDYLTHNYSFVAKSLNWHFDSNPDPNYNYLKGDSTKFDSYHDDANGNWTEIFHHITDGMYLGHAHGDITIDPGDGNIHLAGTNYDASDFDGKALTLDVNGNVVPSGTLLTAEEDPYKIDSAKITGTTTKKLIIYYHTGRVDSSATFADLSNNGNGNVASITLNTPGDINPATINFTGSNGVWSATINRNNQSPYYVYGRHASTSGTPSFGLMDVRSINASGSTYNGTRYLQDDGTWALKEVTTPYTVTYSATPTFDYNNSANQVITLTGNLTSISFSNIPDGKVMYILFKQDATGSRTVPAVASWASGNGKIIGGSLTLTTTASAWDLIGVKRWGTNYLITYGKDFK